MSISWKTVDFEVNLNSNVCLQIPTLPIQGKQALFSEGQEAKDPSVKGGPISLGFSLNLGKSHRSGIFVLHCM